MLKFNFNYLRIIKMSRFDKFSKFLSLPNAEQKILLFTQANVDQNPILF
jgi:hypothetical protein